MSEATLRDMYDQNLNPVDAATLIIGKTDDG